MSEIVFKVPFSILLHSLFDAPFLLTGFGFPLALQLMVVPVELENRT